MLGRLAVAAAAVGPAFDGDYQIAKASLVGKYLVAGLEPLLQPEDVACSIRVALSDVGPSASALYRETRLEKAVYDIKVITGYIQCPPEEAWLVFVAARQQLQPSTSNSFEVELGT